MVLYAQHLCACTCEQVRKSYEEKRKRRRARGQKRPWRLKRMAMELEDEAGGAPGRGREQRGGPGGTRREQDMERFMQACLLPQGIYITAACLMWATRACGYLYWERQHCSRQAGSQESQMSRQAACRCLIIHAVMQELEEDPEMRSKMALYRDPEYEGDAKLQDSAMTDDEDGDMPEVPLEELLDDLTALHLDEEEE